MSPLLLACTSGSTSATKTVHFQTPAGVRFGIPNKSLIQAFKKEHPGIDIVMDTIPVGDFFPKLATEITSSSHSIDLFQSIPPFVGSFAKTNKIVAIQDMLSTQQLDDIVGDIPAHYLDTWRWDGKLYGIPNDSNAQWSFYRKDLFDKVGVKLPQTWDDAPSVAKTLTTGTVKGYTASLRRGEYAGAHFSSIFWTFGGEYWDADYHPTIDSEAGMHALEVMLAMMPYADPGSINAGEDETAQILSSGVAAWAPLEWGRTDLTDPKQNNLADKMGTAVPPAGGPGRPARAILGGLAYMIPSWTDRKQEALDYILFATSKTQMPLFVANSGQPARSSALTDLTNIKLDPYFPVLQKVLAQGHAQPNIPESFSLLVELGNAVAEVLTKGKSPKAGLQAANSAFTDILKKGGYLK